MSTGVVGQKTDLDNAVYFWYLYRQRDLDLPSPPFPLEQASKPSKLTGENLSRDRVEMIKLWMARVFLNTVAADHPEFLRVVNEYCASQQLDEYFYGQSSCLNVQNQFMDQGHSFAKLLYWRAATALNHPWGFSLRLVKESRSIDFLKQSVLPPDFAINHHPNQIIWDFSSKRLVLRAGDDLTEWLHRYRVALSGQRMPLEEGEKLKRLPKHQLYAEVLPLQTGIGRKGFLFKVSLADPKQPVLDAGEKYGMLCQYWMHNQLDLCARQYDISRQLQYELISNRISF